MHHADTPAAPPRGPRRRLAAGAFTLLLAAVGAAVLFMQRDSSGVPEHLILAPAEIADVEETVAALGNLQPRDYVDVGAQVTGQLRKLHVAIGDIVEAGQLLAEIDPAVPLARVEAGRAQLQALNAQLRDQRAQLELAEHKYRREQALMADDATSEDALQVARAAVESGSARIEALEAQIAQTESNLRGDEATLGYTRIYAPMPGTVVSVEAREGQTLNANLQAPIILRIADLSTMTVWTQVSEADVARLRIGMEAYFTTLGDPDRRWRGRLQQILPTPEVLNNVVLYTALFDVDNPEGELMAQMTAQVFFVVEAAAGVLTVPASALQRAAPGSDAWAVDVVENGRIVRRPVSVGARNRLLAEIRSGLAPGTQVVAGRRPPAQDEGRRTALRLR